MVFGCPHDLKKSRQFNDTYWGVSLLTCQDSGLFEFRDDVPFYFVARDMTRPPHSTLLPDFTGAIHLCIFEGVRQYYIW